MHAPVVVFVYSRPEHTKKTIQSLAKNYLAKDTDVYIFSDAAKNERAIPKVEEVRKYIDTLPQRNIFKSVKIIKAEKNKGLANSVISGVTEVINKHDKAIVIEDDLITSPDFLQYMNEALDYYKNDKTIWSISGYSFKIKIPKDYKSDVYLSYRASSWGWATWKDRWEKVDWQVKDYNYFKRNKELRRKLNRGGRDMAVMLDAQMNGEIDSWAIRWCYAQSKLDMLTVYPVISRVKNIGLDGTGTHNSILTPIFGSKYDVILSDGSKLCNFDKPKIDIRITKRFRNRFGSSIVLYMKRNIKKMLRIR